LFSSCKIFIAVYVDIEIKLFSSCKIFIAVYVDIEIKLFSSYNRFGIKQLSPCLKIFSRRHILKTLPYSLHHTLIHDDQNISFRSTEYVLRSS